MNPEQLVDRIARSMAQGIAVTQTLGEGDFRIAMPQTLQDGTPVILRLTIDGDVATASDEETVADHLDMVGVDLTSKTNAASWTGIRNGVGYSVALGSSTWELAASADAALIGPLLQSVADAAIRGDAMRLFAPGHRARSFGERLQVEFQRSEVATVSRAQVPGRGGSKRQVTFSAGKKTPRYIQALSSGKRDQRLQTFDHALSVFTTSVVPLRQRVALFEGPIDTWEQWQVEAVSEVARPVDETTVRELISTIREEDAAA